MRKISHLLLIILLNYSVGLMASEMGSFNNQVHQQEPSFQFVPRLLLQTQLFAEGGLTVVDENGMPIAGAEVFLGSQKLNAVTDSDGYMPIPSSWVGPEDLTIQAVGYIPTTYYQLNPVEQSIALQRLDGNKEFLVNGETTDYGRLRRDGFVDFSLVVPALTRRQILNFNLASVISPYSDKITAAGQSIDVPSNLSLPPQDESYFINIHISKPEYRIPVRQEGVYEMFAAHGKFPFKQVVDSFRRGDSLFKVLNMFTFVGGGQKEVQINGKGAGAQDIPINEMTFDATQTVRAPTLPAGKEMLSLSLVEQGGRLFPTDLKHVDSGKSVTLKMPSSNTKTYSLSVLLDQSVANFNAQDPNLVNVLLLQSSPAASFHQMSIALEESNKGTPVEFLDLVPAPQLIQDKLMFQTPQQSLNIEPIATYVTLSEVVQQNAGSKIPVDKKTRLWEVYAKQWVNEIQLPEVSKTLDPQKKYRWDVMFLGRSRSAASNGGQLIDEVTHVTRTALDL